MVEQSVNPQYPWLDPDQLISFLDELREAGFTVSVEDYAKVHELVIRLLSNGASLEQPQQLGRYLGPLLCSSETEQLEFNQRFENWVDRITFTRQEITDASLLLEELRLINKRGFTRWLRFLVRIFAIILAVLLAVLMSAAEVGKEVYPIPEYPRFTIDYQDELGIIPFFLIVLLILGTTILSRTLFIQWRIQQYLQRQTCSEKPQLETISIVHDTEPLFPTAILFRLAERMRRRVRVASDSLDIHATLKNTLTQGGWLIPTQGTRLQVPEYLVLIDRTTFNDHQSRLIEEMMARLTEHDVFANIYYFDSDPRVCYPSTTQANGTTLSALSQNEGGKRLLLFVDAQNLFHPLRNDLALWTDLFGTWTERALLTTKPREQWGYYESQLQSLMTVMPATTDSLNMFVIGDLLEQMQHQSKYTLAPLPTLLTERPYRWLERDEPNPQEIEQVLLALRDYLDDAGFFWLCACAIFPKIQWGITLYLGQYLTTDDGMTLLTYERLMALSRLPWFRHGYMPDWFRIYLISTLTPAQEKDVRHTLQALLLNAVQGSVGQHQIEITRAYRYPLDLLSRPVLRLLARHVDDSNPLQDHIFLTHLTHGKQLAVQLPVQLRDRLLSGSRRSLDWAIWWRWTFAHTIGGPLIWLASAYTINEHTPFPILLLLFCLAVYLLTHLQLWAGQQRIESNQRAFWSIFGGMVFSHISIIFLIQGVLQRNTLWGWSTFGGIVGLAESVGYYLFRDRSDLKKNSSIKPYARIAGFSVGFAIFSWWLNWLFDSRWEEFWFGGLCIIWFAYSAMTGISLVWNHPSIFITALWKSLKLWKENSSAKDDISKSVLSSSQFGGISTEENGATIRDYITSEIDWNQIQILVNRLIQSEVKSQGIRGQLSTEWDVIEELFDLLLAQEDWHGIVRLRVMFVPLFSGDTMTTFRVMPKLDKVSIEAAERIGDTVELASFLGAKGHNLHRQGFHAEALDCFERSSQLYRGLGKDFPSLKSYYMTASCYRALGNTSEAKTILYNVLDQLEETTPWRGNPLQILGWIYRDEGKLQQSETLLQQALMLQKQDVNPDMLVAGTLTDLGEIVGLQGHVDEAIAYFEQSQAIYDRYPGQLNYLEARTKFRHAELLTRQGNNQQALSLLNQADDLSRMYSDYYDILWQIEFARAYIFLKQGQIFKMLRKLRSAYRYRLRLNLSNLLLARQLIGRFFAGVWMP